MRVDGPEMAQNARPGQFAMLKIGAEENYDPLLRRPLSIHRTSKEKGTVDFLYKVTGRGTKLLAKKKAGERIKILGPLGRGFRIMDDTVPVLVGGGLGVAPLLFLAEEISGRKGVICLGAVTRNQLLEIDKFRETGMEILVATEDGSLGLHGFVTEVLDRMFAGLDHASRQRIQVLSCGPTPMLKAVKRVCDHYGANCQVSLEAFMACGSGLCLGCAVPAAPRPSRKGGEGTDFLHVCKEGPVFQADQIDWERI